MKELEQYVRSIRDRHPIGVGSRADHINHVCKCFVRARGHVDTSSIEYLASDLRDVGLDQDADRVMELSPFHT